LRVVGQGIAFFLRNLPAVMLVLSLVFWLFQKRRDTASLLGWVLLLPIGVSGLWAGTTHVVFPRVAAEYIGWEASPFQFEVGMADLAIGITACVAFWRSWDFRAAAVCVASIFLLGDAVGHVRQMVGAGNFAPGNAGVPFYMDIIAPALAVALLLASRRGALER
jgi:hypothetical protein